MEQRKESEAEKRGEEPCGGVARDDRKESEHNGYRTLKQRLARDDETYGESHPWPLRLLQIGGEEIHHRVGHSEEEPTHEVDDPQEWQSRIGNPQDHQAERQREEHDDRSPVEAAVRNPPSNSGSRQCGEHRKGRDLGRGIDPPSWVDLLEVGRQIVYGDVARSSESA